MKKILISLALLLASSVAAMAQMSGGSAGQAQQGMMGGGMMGPGMMPGGMMGQGQGTMGGGMMGPGMMGPGIMPGGMMGQMMDGMMPIHARGCFGMAGGMMMGNLDMPQMQKSLGLTTEQADKLKAIQRPLQKEAIQIGAAIKVTELDVADLLSADKVDLEKVEGKLKELESLRTKMILNHLRAAEEVKKIVSKEQLEKFQGMCQGCRQYDQPAPPPPAAEVPQDSGQQHQEHHPAQ